jgi:hypothetical protein
MTTERRRMSVPKLVLVLLCALALGGCNRAEPKQPSRQLTEFERDMVTVKNGGFAHVYVFTRKDGQSLQTDDKAFLKQHPPDDVNSMWLLTDGERRVILGTNVDFTPENLSALTKRFTAEDYTNWSPPR